MKAAPFKRQGSWNKTLAMTLALGLSLPGVFISSTTLYAEGFRNPPPGAFSLGRAGGRWTHIDGAAAVAHNPANLVYMRDGEIAVEPTIIHMRTRFASPDGAITAQTKDPWKFLPHLFAATPLYDGRFAIGMGVTVPYGLATEWEQTGAFSLATPSWRWQSPYFAELKTINLNPSVAVRLGDHVSLGAGVNIMWSELRFRQFYPWFNPAFGPLLTGAEGEGEARVRADGWAIGANAGVTFEVTEKQRLALTVRTPMTVDYTGRFEISNAPGWAGPALGATPRSDFKTQIKFPTIVSAGYGIQMAPDFRLEPSVEWIQFSRFDRLNLDAGNNNVLLPSTAVRHDWHNTFTAGIAGDWEYATDWFLRLGYRFYESPVPDHTFSPMIPDANQHAVTGSLSFRQGRHAGELAYGLVLYDDRRIRNNQVPQFNGDYDTTVHLISAAYRFHF